MTLTVDFAGDYFDRLDRVREIMAGNPDYNEEEARMIASQEAGLQQRFETPQ